MLLVVLTSNIQIFAQNNPVFRVDINRSGRQISEGNSPNFLPWTFANANSVTDTLVSTTNLSDTVFVSLNGKTMANVDTVVWTNYYKAGVQAAIGDSKLTLDGAFSRIIEMKIKGLHAGENTLLTYHNNVDGETAFIYNPIKVYVDGVLVVSSLTPTVRELNMARVPLSYLTFNVEAGKEVVIRFEPIPVAGSGATKAFNCVPLNGFEINTPNALHQAYSPFPYNGDEHVDGDAGTIQLKWYKAATAANHNLYFGTDSAAVTNATTSSPLFVGNKILTDTTYTVNAYSLEKYFWRVDEVTSSGIITKGNIWKFRPRILAFKGAEGYGRYATGGRGGKVVYVTNLNSTGPGSFHDAVTQGTGPRTILFNVSGYIDMPARTMMNPYLTIAGQTAPGKGITLRYAPLGVNSESVIRYVRMRLGQTGLTYDGIGMAGANHSIMDHCSVSWTIDEAVSSRGAKNITMQRTLISEALNVAGHQNYPKGTAHGYAGSMGGDTGSLHHNLLAHCEGRNWSMAGGLDGNGYYSGKLDIFNMVVYNWGGRATDGGANEVNFVNNYYKKGPSTTQTTMLKADLEGTGKGSQSYYFAGNIEQNTNGTFMCDGTDNTCGRTYTTSNGQVVDWTVFVSQPFFQSYATIETAKTAYKSVLSNVGANLPLDNHDVRVINETLTGTTTYKGSVSGKSGLIDHHNDAGGYEEMPAESRPASFDTDLDGLPDWWENLHGTNPNSASGDFSDSNADTDKDGYTNLDNYLEWMSVPQLFIPSGQSATIDLAPYTAGYTKNPVYTTSGTSGVNVLYNGSVATVTPSSGSKAIYYFDFKVTDSEGSSMTRTIGVCAGMANPTGVNTVNSTKQYNVYPTVFTNELNFSAHLDYNSDVLISMEDLLGRNIMNKKLSLTSGMNTLTFTCPGVISNQFYMVKISNAKTGEVLAVQKVMRK